MEWLGVGTVRSGFVVDGKILPAHLFHHANNLEDVYMQSPNLPVRWEISSSETSGVAADMAAICATVISEGGRKEQGRIFSADRGNNPTSIALIEEPVISIRLAPNHERMTVIPETFSILAASSANFKWRLMLNPTISDADVVNWTASSGSNAVQYDVTMSGSVSGGTTLMSGYIANASNAGDILIPADKITPLASDYDGTSDILVLTLQKLTAGGVNVYGSIVWNEIR
jgi:hypothetical protein